MPYKVVKNGDKYDVVNTDSDAVVDSHPTEEEAERQVKLLHAVEKDPAWDETKE